MEEWMGWLSRLVLLLFVVTMMACAGRAVRHIGVVHVVGPGETLYRIGKAYGVSLQALSKANRLKNPHRIVVGQKLVIPGAHRRLPVAVITPRDASVRKPLRDQTKSTGKWRFVWPVPGGAVSSGFGRRGNGTHDGIDISAAEGSAVKAARAGVVVFSDKLRGYGYVIIIEHAEGYATVYGHNKSNLVEAGRRVRQGQIIALLGRSGRTSGPNLHFEVRKNNVARNPVFFLPPQTWARAATAKR